jgi:predicted DNA-binding transcriptional regulator AlpA
MSFVSAPPPEGWFTARQIREYLQISEPTLYRWLRAGLPSHQIVPGGRRLYLPSEVQSWIQCRCIAPAPDRAGEQAS